MQNNGTFKYHLTYEYIVNGTQHCYYIKDETHICYCADLC